MPILFLDFECITPKYSTDFIVTIFLLLSSGIVIERRYCKHVWWRNSSFVLSGIFSPYRF